MAGRSRIGTTPRLKLPDSLTPAGVLARGSLNGSRLQICDNEVMQNPVGNSLKMGNELKNFVVKYYFPKPLCRIVSDKFSIR